MSAIGLRVGPFEIDDEAHVPVMGNWFRAHRAGQKRRQPSDVLIRMAGPSPSDAELNELQRYFESLRTLDDSRIPSALAFYEGTGSMAVVADPGISLARLLPLHRDGRLNLDVATLSDIAIDILEAMQHAHGKGFVHGHLSPHMITLTPKGHIWVWGFGQGHQKKPDPQWLSPDQSRSGPATVAGDQWSLGALLGSLVLGHAPWISDDPTGESKIGNVDLFVDSIHKRSPEWAPIIQRMMSVQAIDRYPSLGPVHQEVLAVSRKAHDTSSRRALHQLIERAEAKPLNTAPPKEASIPNEPLNPVNPMVDAVIPEAILEAPSSTTSTAQPAPESSSTPSDIDTPPDVTKVFTPDDTPAASPMDAPPSPGTTQIGKPVPLTFQDANQEGGARTVVPNTDAGTSIEEEIDTEQDIDAEEEKPTVLYTKGLLDDAFIEPTVDTPATPPNVVKESQTPPGAAEPIAITKYAPWLVLIAGVILLVYTLVNIF